MYRKAQHQRLILPGCLLFSLLFTNSGCATGHKEVQDEQRIQALNRWNACLDRNASATESSVLNYNEVLETQCEGHKRDVLLSYPQHLEKRLDYLLQKRTRERTLRATAWKSLSSPEI